MAAHASPGADTRHPDLPLLSQHGWNYFQDYYLLPQGSPWWLHLSGGEPTDTWTLTVAFLEDPTGPFPRPAKHFSRSAPLAEWTRGASPTDFLRSLEATTVGGPPESPVVELGGPDRAFPLAARGSQGSPFAFAKLLQAFHSGKPLEREAWWEARHAEKTSEVVQARLSGIPRRQNEAAREGMAPLVVPRRMGVARRGLRGGLRGPGASPRKPN